MKRGFMKRACRRGRARAASWRRGSRAGRPAARPHSGRSSPGRPRRGRGRGARGGARYQGGGREGRGGRGARAVAAGAGGTARGREPEAFVSAGGRGGGGKGRPRRRRARGARTPPRAGELGIVPLVKTSRNAATAGGGDGRGGAGRGGAGRGGAGAAGLRDKVRPGPDRRGKGGRQARPAPGDRGRLFCRQAPVRDRRAPRSGRTQSGRSAPRRRSASWSARPRGDRMGGLGGGGGRSPGAVQDGCGTNCGSAGGRVRRSRHGIRGRPQSLGVVLVWAWAYTRPAVALHGNRVAPTPGGLRAAGPARAPARGRRPGAEAPSPIRIRARGAAGPARAPDGKGMQDRRT